MFTAAADATARQAISAAAGADARPVDVTSAGREVYRRFAAWFREHQPAPPQMTCPHGPLYQPMATWNLITQIVMCPACTRADAQVRADLTAGYSHEVCDLCGRRLDVGDQMVHGGLTLPSRIGLHSGRVLAAVVLTFGACVPCTERKWPE